MSNYLREVLGAEKTFLNPNQPQGLVADAGPDLPGGEGANEGFWRQQLRDRLGQFAKMFGIVLFDIEIEGLGRITGHGELVEIVRPQVGLVRIKNHPVLKDIDIEIPGENLEAIDALIPDADYERVTGKDLPKSEAPELKDSITGDEAMQVVRNAGAQYAKSQGRFAMSRTYDDVRQGLRAQYMQFLDEIKKDNPDLLKNKFIINEDGTGRTGDIETEDDFWGAITAMQVSTTSRWVSPNNIDPLAKEVNRRYAEKFLGLKKDGLISFYRNVIQEKEDPADAAAGYATFDRKMAWDYNPDPRPGDVLRGRYIVKAKPDEVLGILGYSGALDEFGVVISPEVTSLPGRFERVGDLEKQRIDGAPWVDYEELDKKSRFGGGSPFRFLDPMTNFDYYPLDSNPFGEGNGWASFYEANGLKQGDLPNKYNELYGEGAWEKDFGSGSPRASQFTNLFIKFTDKDGKEKWGLDAPKLRELSSIDMLNNADAGDDFDRNIKVLSTMQELMGEPFFVNKGHSKNDPRLDEVKDEKPAVDVVDFSNFEKVSGQLGSNPGGVYKDPATGKQYYVKIQDKKRGDNEQLASALYREAGIDALEVKSGTLNGDNITFTDWRGEKLDSVYGKIFGSDPIDPDDSAFDGFAIDAWLANWDVVGTGYDNLSFDKDGNPVRLDSGGSLLYRARGDRKGEAFGDEVGELDTFKNPSNTTGELFSGMSPDAEANSVKKLEAITPERIDELVDQFVSNPDDNQELKDKLKARREYILDKYKTEEPKQIDAADDRGEFKLFDKTIDGTTIDLDALSNTPVESTYTLDGKTNIALMDYSGDGYRALNSYFRFGEDGYGNIPDEEKLADIKQLAEILDDLIEKNGTVDKDSSVFRGQRLTEEWKGILENLNPGDTILEPAFLSTANSPRTSHVQFGPGLPSPGSPPDASTNTTNPVKDGAILWGISVPKGSKALQLPTQGAWSDSEDEVLLPRNTELRINGIKKVAQIDPKTGEPTGDYNYFIDAEVFNQASNPPFEQPSEPKEKQEQERSTGLFNEYESERADQITAEDTPLTDLGWEPDEEITIYRGVPDDVDSINSGDWVTTLPQLAKDYAGANGKVVSTKVKAKDLFADPSAGEGAYTEEMVWRPKATKEISKEPKVPSTTAIDMTGTRLSIDSREGLDSLISDLNVIENEASSQAYRDVASELGRPLSLPWDRDRTREGRETYEYIYSAKRFKKDTPKNDEEKELLRIKNLFNENLENNKDLQEAKKALAGNKLYKDLSDALNSEINDFDEDNISFAFMDVGRNLLRPRPRLSKDEIEEFLIESPDYADQEVNDLTYDVTVDVDESVEITNRDLKEFSESAAVSIILPSRALEEVLNEGRMKTVHETKYSQAGNSSEEYRALRVAYESLAFGYDGDSPMEERPVYGLLRSATLPMPEDALMIYGGVKPAQIVLKPEVKSRTTISDRDSLNHFEPTTPLSDPKFEASHVTRMAAVYREATGKNFFETENFAKFGSIEAQVHGGIKLDDIGKVLFYETPSEEIRELLTSKGIIWEVSRDKPYSKPRTFGGGMF
jgi:hypothetical protein